MKRKRKIILIAGLCILLVLAAFAVYGNVAGRRGKASDDVETVTVERMDLSQDLTLSGVVESGSTYSVTSSVADVEVKSVEVSEGDYVEPGDIIAVLDDTGLAENYRNAQNSLDYAERKGSIDVGSARRNYENSIEDRDIQISRSRDNLNDAKNQQDKASTELSGLKKKLASAQADTKKKETALTKAKNAAAPATAELPKKELTLTNALRDVQTSENNLQELKDKGASGAEIATAQKFYDDSVSKLTAVQTQYDALKKLVDEEQSAASSLEDAKAYEAELQAQIRTASAGLDERKAEVRKASDDLEDARLTGSRNVQEQKSALKSARLSAAESEEAPRSEVRKSGRELDECTVTAKAAGVITSVNVKPGDIYKGDVIAVISDEGSYRVSASADQYDISSLAMGQSAEITVAPAQMENTPGRLIHVAKTPKVSTSDDGQVQTSNDYLVEAQIQNPGDKLRIGMTAKVVVKIRQKKDVLAVPDNCVQTDENGERYVTVVDDDGNTKDVNVKYGMKTDYYSEIEGSGIMEGVRVMIPSVDMSQDMGAGSEE